MEEGRERWDEVGGGDVETTFWDVGIVNKGLVDVFEEQTSPF